MDELIPPPLQGFTNLWESLTIGNIAYVIFIYLLFLSVIGSLYLLFYHLYRSFQWPGEAKIQWTYRIYFGHAWEFGKKPIFQILEPFRGKVEDVIGLLISGQRYFFINDPRSAKLILRENFHIHTTNSVRDNLYMNFFNITPMWNKNRKPLVSKEVLRSLHEQFFMEKTGSIQQLLDRMVQKMKLCYVQELILPVSSLSSNLFAVDLQEFISRCIFHVQLATFFQSDANNTPEKASSLYLAYQNYVKILPLSIGGIHLQYFPASERSYQQLLQTFRLFTHSISDIQQQRLQYFYKLVEESSTFRSELHKYQLAFFWSSITNVIPFAFWVIYCILHHQHYHPDQQIITRIRKEIKDNISNCDSFSENQLLQEYMESKSSSKKETNCSTGSTSMGLEELNHLLLLDACITETLRLTSGSLILHSFDQRKLFTFASGKDYEFRSGDRLGFAPSIFHYDENYYDNPHDFQPDRWLQGETFSERLEAAQGKVLLTTKDGQKIERYQIIMLIRWILFVLTVSYFP